MSYLAIFIDAAQGTGAFCDNYTVRNAFQDISMLDLTGLDVAACSLKFELVVIVGRLTIFNA
jgi:hypothetical protein